MISQGCHSRHAAVGEIAHIFLIKSYLSYRGN
jgi:hypothetical protein